MRKLSKKISMLMVLAMLVSLFSGIVSASAASSWSFYDRTADVVVERNETYVMEKNQYANFDLYCEGEEADADTYSYYWESSNPDVVFVDKTNGRLRADKYGKAEAGDKAMISVYIDNKTTKKNENAKRSFYIQIAEDEVEDVEYAVTTKIGDAVLGTEALEAGKDYALTSTVTADGKVVEAVVTYTLDGAAIDKLNVKEGEYKVVATATVDGKVVATEEYAVVVAGAEISAKATGVKEITVYGNFAKDAKFTVKKDATQNVSFTAVVAEDGKSATLALKNKLSKGEYTVSYADASVVIVAEDEKVDEIIIFEKDGMVLTVGTDSVIVHYDLLNQYGESVRKNFDVDWSHNLESEITDRTNGIVTLSNAGEKLDYNDFIHLTGVVSGFGFSKSETAIMHVGLEQNIDTVGVVGIIKDSDDSVFLQEIPASFIGAPYWLVFEAYDAAGYIIDLEKDASKVNDLKYISMNPLLVEVDEKTATTKSINGKTYGIVQINAGKLPDQVRKGGVANIHITSTKTGNYVPYDLRVVSDQILDEFKIFAPDDLVIVNDPWNRNTEVTLAFEATDIDGNTITDYRAMYDAVKFTDDAVKLIENNDGTATLKYGINSVKADAVTPTDNSDGQVMFNAIVSGTGKMSSCKFRVKAARYVASVSDLVEQSGSTYIVEGNTINIDLVDNRSNGGNELRLEFSDQYDETVKSTNFFGVSEEKKGQYIGVKLADESVLKVVNSNAGIAGDKGEYYLFNPSSVNQIQLKAVAGCTDTTAACDVEFAVFDADKKIVGGSDKKFTFYATDISELTGFSVGLKNDTTWWGSTLKYETDKYSTTGMTAILKKNGKKVKVQDAVDTEYYVEYTGKGNVFTTEVVSGAALNAVVPTLKEDNTDVFVDFSKPTQNMGQYAGRTQSINIVAEVYEVGIGADKYVGGAKGSLNVSNDDMYATNIALEGNANNLNPHKWTNDAKTEALVKAEFGIISKDVLMKFVTGVGSNFNRNIYGKNVIDLKISDMIEAQNGFNVDGTLTEIAGTILNAEIGDTFVVTYSYEDLAHVVKFTVGSDLKAYIQGDDEASDYR